MGKPVSSNVERAETTALNTRIDEQVFNKFKDYCGYRGYQMNVLLETFMRQYTNGRFKIKNKSIVYWKENNDNKATLNTTFDKEIYTNFKSKCKENGYFVKNVVMAFMEELTSEEYILEYVKPKKTK